MLPYLLIFFSLYSSIIYDRTKFEKLVFVFLSFVLFIFSAFRVGGTGPADYDAYLRLYSKVASWENVVDPTIHAEAGFRILSYVGNAAGFDGQFIIFSMALLSAFPIMWVIHKYSCYRIISLLVWMPYFLTMNMHASRVSVAAAFGLLFIINYYYSKKIISLLFLLLAISFHSSAICLLLVFLTKLTYRQLMSVFCISIFFGFTMNPLILIADAFKLVGLDIISWMIVSYISSDDYGYPMKFYDPRIILGVVTIFLIYNIRKSIVDAFDNYVFKLFFIGMILIILFSSVTIIAWRLSYFYLISCVLVIPLICKYYNYRFSVSLGYIRVMSNFYSLIYVLYVFPIVYNAQSYGFYLG